MRATWLALPVLSVAAIAASCGDPGSMLFTTSTSSTAASSSSTVAASTTGSGGASASTTASSSSSGGAGGVAGHGGALQADGGDAGAEAGDVDAAEDAQGDAQLEAGFDAGDEEAGPGGCYRYPVDDPKCTAGGPPPWTAWYCVPGADTSVLAALGCVGGPDNVLCCNGFLNDAGMNGCGDGVVQASDYCNDPASPFYCAADCAPKDAGSD